MELELELLNLFPAHDKNGVEIDIPNKISNTPKEKNIIITIFIKAPFYTFRRKGHRALALIYTTTRRGKFTYLSPFNLVYFATYEKFGPKL